MRSLIYVSIFLFGTIGGWIGAALDHGNWFGAWSIVLGAVGSFFGIWVGYKASQNF